MFIAILTIFYYIAHKTNSLNSKGIAKFRKILPQWYLLWNRYIIVPFFLNFILTNKLSLLKETEKLAKENATLTKLTWNEWHMSFELLSITRLLRAKRLFSVFFSLQFQLRKKNLLLRLYKNFNAIVKLVTMHDCVLLNSFELLYRSLNVK